MSSGNDFEPLRKLLALKRHEQPPPGYFENFSARVISQVQLQAMQPPVPWWKRLFVVPESRPVMAWSLAGSVALLFLTTVVVATRLGQEDPGAAQTALTVAPVNGSIAQDPVLLTNTTPQPSLFNRQWIDTSPASAGGSLEK